MNYYVASEILDEPELKDWMDGRVVEVRRMGSFRREVRMDGLGEKGRVVCVKRL